MKIDSFVFTSDKILQAISKTEPNYYCVFIQPSGIVNSSDAINELELCCDKYNLMSDTLLLEVYDNKDEAIKRVDKFSNLNNLNGEFYSGCFKNGKFICENR